VKAQDIASGFLNSLDEGMFQAVYRLASVDEAEIFKELKTFGLNVDSLEAVGRLPTQTLDSLADRFIRRARRTAALSGASLGLGGWLGLPSGLVHMVVVILRLGQRLSLTYGFDYRSDRGEIELWKALARAVDAKVDWEGTEAELMRRLPAVVTGTGTFSNPLLLKAFQSVVMRIAASAGLHLTRWVPLVGGGTGLVINYLEVDKIGRRLKADWRANHALADFKPEDAQEVEILR
jgi:hypothetical protein